MSYMTILFVILIAVAISNGSSNHEINKRYLGGRLGRLGGNCGYYCARSDTWGGYYRSWYNLPYYRSWYSMPYSIYSYWRRATIDARPRVECNYYLSRATLNCTTPTNYVDCEAYGLFDKYRSSLFSFYAIAVTPNGNLSNTDTVSYSLYPEMLEERGWLNTTLVDPSTNKQSTYSIYTGPETQIRGIRVNSSLCFNRLVNLFSGIGFNETIIVGSKNYQQIDVIGGILLV